MSYDQELNEARLEHGTQVVEFLDSVRGKPDAADKIVEFYEQVASGRTDPDDYRGMISDIMADVAHCAHEEGVSFAEIVEGASKGSDNPYSEIYRLMEKALVKDGGDYQMALTVVEVHVNTELDFPARRR